MEFPSREKISRDVQLRSCHGNHSSLLFMTLRSLKFVRFPSSEIKKIKIKKKIEVKLELQNKGESLIGHNNKIK